MGEHDAKQQQVAQPSTAKTPSSAPSPKQARLVTYLTERSNAQRLWQAIDAHLADVDLPAPPRTEWGSEHRFVRATLEYFQPFPLFLKSDRFPELLFPAKPYDAIERIVPARSVHWEPAIGVALAPLFEQAILGSLRRLGPKWIEHAEHQPQPEALLDESISLVAESALVPGHPMDLAVRRGLSTNGVVTLKGYVLPAHKRKALRAQRNVKVEWQGARDPALWNFVRPEPADATAEEVAAALFTSAFWRAGGVVYAHRLTRTGNLFGVPTGMARLAGAREPATKSRDVASAAMKANAGVTESKVAPIKIPELRSKLASSSTRLAYLQETLKPWKLAQQVAIGIGWVESKQRQSDEEVTRSAGAIVEQDELLGTLVDKFLPFEKRELSTDELAALRPAMALYARAAASSHLAATCRNLIASADGKQTDFVVQALRGATVDMVATTHGKQDPHTVALAARSRQLQTQLLQTGAADPDEIEATLLGSQEVALEVRLSELHAQAKQLRELAIEAESVFVQSDFPFELVLETARWMTSHVEIIKNSWRSGTAAVPGSLAAALQSRRADFTRAQTAFDEVRRNKGLLDLLKHGPAVVERHATRVRWTKLFVEIGVTIGTMLVPPLGIARLAGMVARVGSGAGWVARGGRILAAGIKAGARPAAEIAISSGTSVALHGGSLSEALLENTLQTLASTLILRRLGRSLELSKTLERETVHLWSARSRAGTAILEHGVEISAHLILNVATAYVARQIAQKILPVHVVAGGGGGGALEDVFMQGVSIGLGRYAHRKLAANQQLDDKLVRHSKGAEVDRHRRRLLALADLAETAPRPGHALELMAELEALNRAKHDVLVRIRDNKLPHDGSVDPIEAGWQAKQLERSEFHDSELHVLPLHEAHLEEVIPGKHWAGTPEQIIHALKLARRVFAVTEVREQSGIRRVKINQHELILEERSFETPRRAPVRAAAQIKIASAETRAELVPGSDFRGRSSGAAVVDQATVFHTLEHVLGAARGVAGVTRLAGDHTVLVKLTSTHDGQPRHLTIRIETAPLEGQTVARSWVNSTQQGFSTVDKTPVRVLGRHVIQISDELGALHIERAIAHEAAEIFEIDRLNFAGEYARPDALRPGATGHELSPHDRGRLAEVEVLARTKAGDPATELHALVEHLGLREGTAGAVERLALASKHLSAEAGATLAAASKVPTGEVQVRLAALRERAAQDHAHERAEAATRERAGPEMPSLTDAAGKPLTGPALAHRVAVAEQARAAESHKTWAKLSALHVENGYPVLPYPVMIGGGASLAARDRAYLLVDDRGRWHADGNLEIAQTGNQLKHAADAKLGDPRKHALPNQRLSLEAVRAWEDEIAIQGPVLNGRANLRFGPKGESLIDLTVGGELRTFQLPSDPLIATGFVPEQLPGAPFGKRPSDAAKELRAALEGVATREPDGSALKTAAREAIKKLDSMSISTNQDAVQFVGADIKPLLQQLVGTNDAVSRALAYGEAAKNWAELIANDDPNHPHVFFGDHANLGRAQALRSNNWVIGGTGGTGISAAEIVLANNPQAKVVMVGTASPDGLLENDQFRLLAETHADKVLAASMGITKPTSERLSIQQGRVAGPKPVADAHQPLVDESGLDPKVRSKRVIDANAATDDGKRLTVQGTAYVAALGRNNDYPPTVLQLIEQVKKLPNGDYFVLPLFHDRQYIGYRVRFVKGEDTIRSVDVTGAASRYLPIEDAKQHADIEALKHKDPEKVFADVKRATSWDAPAESGNFAGGFAATATQASRYARHHIESKGAQK